MLGNANPIQVYSHYGAVHRWQRRDIELRWAAMQAYIQPVAQPVPEVQISKTVQHQLRVDTSLPQHWPLTRS